MAGYALLCLKSDFLEVCVHNAVIARLLLVVCASIGAGLCACGLLLGSRDVVGGMEWVKSIAGTPDVAKQVEKGKSQFAGHEILGKSLGVIGLGAVGGPFANAARKLGMQVYGCDPFLSLIHI